MSEVWFEGLREEEARIWSHLEPGRVSTGWTSVWNFVEISSATDLQSFGEPVYRTQTPEEAGIWQESGYTIVLDYQDMISLSGLIFIAKL